MRLDGPELWARAFFNSFEDTLSAFESACDAPHRFAHALDVWYPLLVDGVEPLAPEEARRQRPRTLVYAEEHWAYQRVVLAVLCHAPYVARGAAAHLQPFRAPLERLVQCLATWEEALDERVPLHYWARQIREEHARSLRVCIERVLALERVGDVDSVAEGQQLCEPAALLPQGLTALERYELVRLATTPRYMMRVPPTMHEVRWMQSALQRLYEGVEGSAERASVCAARLVDVRDAAGPIWAPQMLMVLGTVSSALATEWMRCTAVALPRALRCAVTSSLPEQAARALAQVRPLAHACDVLGLLLQSGAPVQWVDAAGGHAGVAWLAPAADAYDVDMCWITRVIMLREFVGCLTSDPVLSDAAAEALGTFAAELIERGLVSRREQFPALAAVEAEAWGMLVVMLEAFALQRSKFAYGAMLYRRIAQASRDVPT